VDTIVKNYVRYILLCSLVLTCRNIANPTKNYQAVYDPTLPGTQASATECSNPQAANTIPSVTFTTALLAFSNVTVRDLELGAINTGGTTIFRVYAPTAQTMDVLIYNNAPDEFTNFSAAHAMTRDNQSGVWYANGIAVSAGAFYRYRINCMYNYENKPMKESQRYIPDPYARANVGSTGHSIVRNKTSDQAYNWGTTGYNTPTNRHHTRQSVVYEVHVGDFSGHTSCTQTSCAEYVNRSGTTRAYRPSTNAKKGKYQGMHDMLDYFGDLGINTLELMPVHEFVNDADKNNTESYSWGYLPVLFFAPESSYASSNTDGSSIAELKDLVKSAHEKNMAVILDVVLTHVSNEYNYLYWIEPSSRYYFRLSGTSWSNLGTGNWIDDDKTNKPFAYKMVLDNLKYWAEEFHIDGYRFDLVVGTREDTLKDYQIAAESYTYKPMINTGENWFGSTRHGFMIQSNESTFPANNASRFSDNRDTYYRGFAQWNDYFRESVKSFIKGDTSAQTTNRTRTSLYFSKSRDDSIWQGVSKHPVDTLNYIESHDEESIAHAVYSNEAKAGIGALLLLTAHGIPMLQEGQEFLRDKAIQDQSKDSNALLWSQIGAKKGFFNFVSYLATLRKNCAALNYGHEPTQTGNEYSEISASINQTISFFTKYTGSACTASLPGGQRPATGMTEFRILANMTGGSQSFVIETGGATWKAIAQVEHAAADCSLASPAANYFFWGAHADSGAGDLSGWAGTTGQWTLKCYSAVILTKT
jgi:pullulanase